MRYSLLGLALVACTQNTPNPASAKDIGRADAAAPLASTSAPTPVTAPSATVAAPPVDAAAPADGKRIALTDEKLQTWVDARVAATKAGRPERVRIPLVRHGNGWGCVCPPDYVGDDPNVGQGPWLEPSFTKGARAPRVGERVFAEGTFGAGTKHVRYPNGPPPTDHWEYDLVPFVVTKTAPIPEGTEDVLLELL